jgi:nicotinate-nucleotide adenylyltransferase
MTANRRIGILGGTFDPFHTGHVALASAAQERLGLSELLVIPSHLPPHRPQPLASSFHRFAMAALAIAGRSGWRLSDIELIAGGPSYTTDTIRLLHDRGYAPSELFFIIGIDAFLEIATWKDYPAILERAHFAVVARPGWQVSDAAMRLPQLAHRMRSGASRENGNGDRSTEPIGVGIEHAPAIFLIDAPTPDVSATAIRQHRAEGASIAGMVDPRVQQHIEQHDLYPSIRPGRRTDDQINTPAAGRLHGQG